jgi:hypothetical protein
MVAAQNPPEAEADVLQYGFHSSSRGALSISSRAAALRERRAGFAIGYVAGCRKVLAGALSTLRDRGRVATWGGQTPGN